MGDNITIDIVGIDAVSKKIRKRIDKIDDIVLGKSSLTKLAKESANDIRIRTRLGFGLSKRGAAKRPLKRLSEAYIEVRQGKRVFFKRGGRVVSFTPKKIKKVKLSRFTKAKFSNLTFTGQMLSSLFSKYRSRGIFLLTFKDKRKGGKIGNKALADINEKNGRKFLELTNKEVLKLKNRLAVNYKKLLRRLR